MEIPYTVTARPDTGLWNAKVGIWLFLASEVMLFGGLFSSYVFLRLGADYPWPMEEMKVILGFINTLVLIASSVTVVMAWASLKMRRYRAYQGYMIFTIVCACTFMVIKFFEYKAKFEHYAITFDDGSKVAGHLEKGTDTRFEFEASSATVDFNSRAQDRFLTFMENRADNTLRIDGKEVDINRNWFLSNQRTALYAAQAQAYGSKADTVEGEAVAAEEAGRLDEAADLRADAAALREKAAARQARFDARQEENPGEGGTNPLEVEFSSAGRFSIPQGDVREWTDTTLTLRDGTVLQGRLVRDTVKIVVDELDMRVYLKPDANGRQADPAEAKVFTYEPLVAIQEDYEHYREEELRKHDDYRTAWLASHPGKRFPEKTFQEFERVYLDQLHASHEGEEHPEGEGGEAAGEGAEGETGGAGEDAHHHPTIEVNQRDIAFISNYTPRKNPFYAIYFTMTGLHGLHVVGGAIVLAYHLIFGGALYRKNPEHLANRVEVAGLFWHFVDLVWIFLFPIFYLM